MLQLKEHMEHNTKGHTYFYHNIRSAATSCPHTPFRPAQWNMLLLKTSFHRHFFNSHPQIKQLLPTRIGITMIQKEQQKGNSFPYSLKNIGCLLQEINLVHITHRKFFISPSFVEYIKHLGNIQKTIKLLNVLKKMTPITLCRFTYF